MKKLSILIAVIVVVLTGIYAAYDVYRSYLYNREIQSYWDLADKSSTIQKKSEYIDIFVDKLEQSGLHGNYNAIWQTTPDNSFDCNFDALKTLQKRLHDVQNMEVTSFEYQTAMQQITGQEQGESADMISVFKGTWTKEHYPLMWGWISAIIYTLIGLSWFFTILFIIYCFEDF